MFKKPLIKKIDGFLQIKMIIEKAGVNQRHGVWYKVNNGQTRINCSVLINLFIYSFIYCFVISLMYLSWSFKGASDLTKDKTMHFYCVLMLLYLKYFFEFSIGKLFVVFSELLNCLTWSLLLVLLTNKDIRDWYFWSF